MKLDEEGLVRAFEGRDDLVGAVRNAAAGEFGCLFLGSWGAMYWRRMCTRGSCGEVLENNGIWASSEVIVMPKGLLEKLWELQTT